MKIKIMKEEGHQQALIGLSLSYNVEDEDKIKMIAKNLSQKDGGHNKFLESIILWIDIDAPRYWWSQFDTYRIGITKQSESTMHSLMKKELNQDDFEDFLFEASIEIVNSLIRSKEFEAAKAHLPESFLQRRIVCTNYKVLRNIIQQRKTHKLKQWHFLINELYNQVKYPEFLPSIKE